MNRYRTGDTRARLAYLAALIAAAYVPVMVAGIISLIGG